MLGCCKFTKVLCILITFNIPIKDCFSNKNALLQFIHKQHKLYDDLHISWKCCFNRILKDYWCTKSIIITFWSFCKENFYFEMYSVSQKKEKSVYEIPKNIFYGVFLYTYSHHLKKSKLFILRKKKCFSCQKMVNFAPKVLIFKDYFLFLNVFLIFIFKNQQIYLLRRKN